MTNVVVLIGRLTKDIDLKKSQSGMSVARFTLAVNRMKKDEADFISCVVFDKRADTMYQYLHKGSQVAIEGRIQTGSYEKDGRRVYTTEVVIEGFTFVDNKVSGSTDNAQVYADINKYSQSQSRSTLSYEEFDTSEGFLDIDNADLPF